MMVKYWVLGALFALAVFLPDTFSLLHGKEAMSPLIKDIITSTFKIDLKQFPGAFNPSICEVEEGYILTFRYGPEYPVKWWISHVGAVLLDRSFRPISEPQLLPLKISGNSIPSQSEDARVFSWNGKPYIVYNDSMELGDCSIPNRRDIYLSELSYKDGQFTVSTPLKLYYPERLSAQAWEKNWVPFIWNNSLFLSYTLDPHEVLYPDLKSGISSSLHLAPSPTHWKWGTLRGGTPAILVDGEYLAFFHSSQTTVSAGSEGMHLRHYFMGAYTFSSDPPFNITKVSRLPIMAPTFYTKSDFSFRVIYPSGFVISGETIYLSYGKDDHEIWIAEINKKRLMESLRPTG